MANPSRLSAALAAWDRRTSHRAEDLAQLGRELAEAAREVLAEQDGARDAIDLASLPVHFIAHLPRGRVFMHPDTWRSGVRDPWPPSFASTLTLHGPVVAQSKEVPGE